MSSIRANRQHWNLTSRRYQEEHDQQIGAAPRLWGMFAIADSHLNALSAKELPRGFDRSMTACSSSRVISPTSNAV